MGAISFCIHWNVSFVIIRLVLHTAKRELEVKIRSPEEGSLT